MSADSSLMTPHTTRSRVTLLGGAVQTSMIPRQSRKQHGGAVGRRCVRRRIGESPRMWAGQGLNPEEPHQVVAPRDQC